MTNDDDMREIEAALEDFEDFHRELWSARAIAVADEGDTKRCREARDRLLALIRAKLDARSVATDAEHEAKVQAWRLEATDIANHCGIARELVLRMRDDALRLMRARPATDTAAGELLRAAKDVLHNFHVDMEQEHRSGFYGPQDVDAMHAMGEAVEAAERAEISP